MFNPHIHQQQQQHQIQQHLRQLQQLFHQQQQQPPPAPPQPAQGHHVAHHHPQAPRPMPVPPQSAPHPRMVRMCQATQTTIIAPNPMLQGAILMQQMQGNMRSFGMGGQQFRQFFAAGARSSLLGPVPMGVAMKSPVRGFPGPRSYHPPARYYNNTTSSSSSSTATLDTAARQPDRKRDMEHMVTGSTDEQPAASSTVEAEEQTETDVAMAETDKPTQPSEEYHEEPVVKKQRTEGSEYIEQTAADASTVVETDDKGVSPEYVISAEEGQPEDCILLEEGSFTGGLDAAETGEESRAAEVQSSSAPSPNSTLRKANQAAGVPPEGRGLGKNVPLSSEENLEEGEEGIVEGGSKFYCYLCSITCFNQQNFRSHMNSVSHQQRMMEIQHMSNACLVSLLPRLQESLLGAQKDGEKKSALKRWCVTCQTHFTCSVMEHRRTEDHKFATRTTTSSCSVCKKHFRTSQVYVEHLQSQEHRWKVEKLEEKESSDTLAKLSSMDTEGCSVEDEDNEEEEEEGDGEVVEEDEGDQQCSNQQGGWSSVKEASVKEMASDEEYDPDTIYGSGFLVPVAGVICRLCKKFYCFESSASHSHCKSMKHFENLKKYRCVLSEKGAAVESHKEPVLTDLGPEADPSTDYSDENSLFDTGLLTSHMTKQPTIALEHESMRILTPQQADSDSASLDFISASANTTGIKDQDFSLNSEAEETTFQSVEQESATEQAASSSQDPDGEPAATGEDPNEEEKGSSIAAKDNYTGKAKGPGKRRSGRATNRR
ncbi:cdkn1a interacting zinc finger protein 1a isoform X2 [Thalassophryne amazonica]|uniref:cdkn1a interacting zinc finger protein 1a isoform X2 n=1 Tax=Thalassophryne amazonica TaxID=390379 RepID=UPI0014718C6D|nr:cdkn1a interacting zinc finger protein 1a isoform X2 [Thalassophryne amazonica]